MIPPCIVVAVLLHFSAPFIAELKAILPEGFLTSACSKPDLDREIRRLLDGAGR